METNLPQTNQKIPAKGQHSAVLAYIGQLALSKPAAADLFSDVTTLIAHILPADLVWLWELDPGGQQLILRTNSRWKNGSIVESRLPIEQDSLEALVLRSSYPILVQEFNTDLRFKPSNFLQAAGATSGLAVAVGTLQKPYGILQAFSSEPHTYSQNDIHFFHGVANVLALFLDAKHPKMIGAPSELEDPAWQTGPHDPSRHMEQEQDEIKNRLVDGRERERLQLAQELHDVPVQDLYGLMYQMDDLKEILKDTNGMEILQEFDTTLHRVLNNLRTICGELRPPALSPFGLEVAIRDHVEKLYAIHPELQFHLDLMRDQQILPDGIRLRLFRIYQQAISNVIRHAQASDVHIRFRWDDRVVVLEVEDNGAGFEVPERWVDLLRQERFGLVGIAERVASMQGKMEIVSTPGTGTSVRVRVPRR